MECLKLGFFQIGNMTTDAAINFFCIAEIGVNGGFYTFRCMGILVQKFIGLYLRSCC